MYLSASENKTDIVNEFEKWIETIPSENNIIITGDFYINFLNESSIKKRLEYICADIGLKQLINSPTRVTSNSSTMIDLCFSNIHSLTVASLDDDQISDHKNIEITLKSNQCDKKTTIKL